jgi:arylsulfatase A-like enzyme
VFFASLLAACASRPAPNLVVVSIDTLRADHLGIYGYSRPTSPRIDAWARGGTVFDRAFAPSSWTLPSHASMFTGLSPFRHGATHWDARIPDEAPMLAERLRRRGYATGGAVNAPFVGERFGFRRGFDAWVERRKRRETSDDEYQRLVLELVRAERRRPFFLFLHYMNVHEPYDPPAGYDRFASPGAAASSIDGSKLRELQLLVEERRAAVTDADRDRLVDLYDGEILAMDEKFGALLDAIQRVSPDTIVVLTSDHGEEFLEHGGLTHGRTLYEEVLRVPLIVVGPGVRAGARSDALVSLIDVAPTLLDLAGAEPLRGSDGESIRSLLAGGGGPRPRPIALHTTAADRRVNLRGLRDASTKLIEDTAAGRREYYDLSADPREREDLYPTRQAASFEKQLAALEMRASVLLKHGPSADELESLRSLGYVR